MLNVIRTLSVMACGLFLHTNIQAAEILIDDFSTRQGPLFDSIAGGVGPASQVSTDGTDIVGGWRDIYIEEVDNGLDDLRAPDSLSLGIRAQVRDGRFTAVLDDLVKGYAVVTYDGANEVGTDWETGVDTTGLGGQSWAGTNGFLFEGVSNDIVAPAQLIIWTDDLEDGNYVKHVLDFETFGAVNEGGLYDAFIPVAWFDDAGSINWTNVGAFQAIFNLDSTNNPSSGVISVDLSLSRAITEIPEPAALSVFGVGVLIMGFIGYRRKQILTDSCTK